MRSLEGTYGLEPHADVLLFYKLDLTTPGISPLRASERKQRRHTPNLRRNARGRPQSWQRLCWRDLNFGGFASLTRFAVVYIIHSQSYSKLGVFGDLPAENELSPGSVPLLRANPERHA